MIDVVIDEAPQQVDDRRRLVDRGLAEVDALVIEPPQRLERLAHRFAYRDHARGQRRRDGIGHEGVKLAPPRGAAVLGDERRKLVARHDLSVNGVLEVMGAVGDPVRERDDLALGRGGRRTRPGVVADPVQGLGAQVERRGGYISAPNRMVEALRQER